MLIQILTPQRDPLEPIIKDGKPTSSKEFRHLFDICALLTGKREAHVVLIPGVGRHSRELYPLRAEARFSRKSGRLAPMIVAACSPLTLRCSLAGSPSSVAFTYGVGSCNLQPQ